MRSKTTKPSPILRLTYENFRTGRTQTLEFYDVPERSDQFRVEVDGNLWIPRAGISDILARLRKAIARNQPIGNTAL